PTAGQGFTLITSGGDVATEYKSFDTTPLSNLAVTFGDTVTDYWIEIADTIQAPIQWPTSAMTYDYYGNMVSITDFKGSLTTFAYNSTYSYAYLTRKTLNDGSVYNYGYNFTTGNLRRVTDAMSNTTTYENDRLSRITKVTYPLSAYVQYSYNDQSNYVNITNENNWKTRQFYDGLSRLSRTETFSSSSGGSYSNVTYTYNWMDKTTTKTHQLLHLTSYYYDPIGRLITTISHDRNVTSIFYDDQNSRIR